MRALSAVLLVLLLGAAGGCGGGASKSATTAAGTATTTTGGSGGSSAVGASADRAVVEGWSSALRSGNIAAADAYFRVPALVQAGPGSAVRLRTRSQVHEFDIGLPCGARLVRSLAHHGYLLAEFRLTERRGPGGGSCDGPGGLASTAFLIRAGHIVEWRRIANLPSPGQTPEPLQPDAPSGAVPA